MAGLNYPELYQKSMGLHSEFGYGSRKIARILGISRGTVRAWIRGHKPSKYANLDTSPALSYLLGVLLGDGWVTTVPKWNVSRVGLEAKDKEFVDCFGENLRKIGLNPLPIYLEKRNVYRVLANNKRFVQWYKGLSLQEIEQIANKHPIGFIRGFYESEGCFYVHPRGGWILHIFNKKKDLLEMSRRILSNLGIEMKLSKCRGEPHLMYSLHLWGRVKIQKFFEQIKPVIKTTHSRAALLEETKKSRPRVANEQGK